MKFIIDKDWDMQIRQAVLSVIKGSAQALNDCIDTSISEADSYLRTKYDVVSIFAPVITWDSSTSYAKDTRILFTANAFSAASNYVEDDLVVYNSTIYKAKAAISASAWDASEWDELCADKTLFYVTATNTTAGYLPTSNEYAEGDTRYPILLTYVKDLALYHLHTQISPQNIPTLRKERYDAAIKWLTKVSKDELSVNLPLLDEDVPSNSFRLGSNDKYSARW